MPTQDTSPIKEKIINYIQINGPTIPVHIAKETDQSMLFASAFLGELLSEKKLKISHMKLGNSPIYYIPGQEKQMEKHWTHLKSKEKEAFEILKEKGVLKDSEQPPPIRVALRAIKDFAFPFKKNDEIYWRYLTVEIQTPPPIQNSENTSTENIPPKKEESEEENRPQKPVENNSEEETKGEEKPKEEEKKIQSPPPKKEEINNEVEFDSKVKEYLKKYNIKLLEEIDVKKREFYGYARLETLFGETEMIILGKDKKSINEKDIEKTLELIMEEKKMALLLLTGEIAKSAKDLARENKNLIIFKKI